MTILNWPADLPAPERNTWRSTPQEARQKRQSDAGPQGYRRRFSSVAKTVNLSVILKRQQKAVFDTFFERDTRHGIIKFWMPDPTTDGWALLTSTGSPLLTDDGTPMLLAARWLCQFGEELPVETIQGVEFRKTFSITVLP